MQTTVQNANALRFGSGILQISQDNGNNWKNLGALKEATLKYDFKISEIVFDNAKLPPKAKINEVIFSAKLAEIDLVNIYALMSVGAYTATPGTLVTVTLETLVEVGAVWNDKTLLKIPNGNGVGTAVTITALKNNATDITDYEVVVVDGETYLLNSSGANVTALTNGIRVSYTYTPNEMVQILYSDVLQYLATNRFRFVNTNEAGQEFGIEIFEGYNRSGIELLFRGDDDTENVMELPIELKAYPTSSNQLFRIFDEQAVA